MSDNILPLDLHDRWILILLGQEGEMEYLNLLEKLTILVDANEPPKGQIAPAELYKQRIEQLERDDYIYTRITDDKNDYRPLRIVGLSDKGKQLSKIENNAIEKERKESALDYNIRTLREIENVFVAEKATILKNIERIEKAFENNDNS